jgi:hypothetical protein
MELRVVGVGEARCHICASVRAGRRQPPSCTSLLYDPATILGTQRRWPDHLCYSDFMERSIERWVSQAVPQVTPANKLWAECYPLPIGKAAVKRRYNQRGQICGDELMGLLPFEAVEEAYWALRVETNRSVLDMFGLKGSLPPTENARAYLWFGSFAYSLRGHDDTSLVGLMQNCERWWRDFSSEKIQGRPRGSGIWESPEHFERAAQRAAREIRAHGRKVTQEALAEQFRTSDRMVRHWLKSSSFANWREFLETL